MNQNHMGGEGEAQIGRGDAGTRSLSAAHMLPYIKMHANRFALSLPPPGIHNQPMLLAAQNRGN